MSTKGRRITIKKRAAYTKFRAWMQENNVKQKHIAEILGLSIASVSAKLSGVSGDFSMADVRKICEYYKISADTYFVKQKVS